MGTRGFKHTEDAKRRIAQAMKGRPKSEETRRKMSESKKRAKRATFLGRRHSEDAKRKISLARLGVGKGVKRGPHSEETKRKISERLKGNKNFEGHSHDPSEWTKEMRELQRIRGLLRQKDVPPNEGEWRIMKFLALSGVSYEYHWIAEDRFSFDFKVGRMLIECDGYWHRKNCKVMLQDMKKNAWAKDNGFKLVRVSYEDAVRGNLDVLKQEVLASGI